MTSLSLRIRSDLFEARYWRFRLHLHVGVIIALLLLVFGLIIVAFNNSRAQQMALTDAGRVFDAVGKHAGSEILSLFRPVAGAVELTARLPGVEGETLDERWGLLPFMAQALNATPTISALYVGYNNGEFFLVRPVRGNPQIFEATAAPPQTEFVVQSIENNGESSEMTFFYLDRELRVIGKNNQFNTGYDPRVRGWYRQAAASDGVVPSRIYVFSTTQELGATLARRLQHQRGVVGADMALTQYAARLEQLKIGDDGRIVIVNDRGEIAVANDIDALLRATRIRPGGTSKQPLVVEFGDPIVSGVYRDYTRSGSGETRISRIAGSDWLWRFSDLSVAGIPMKIGIIAPGELFLAESRRMRDTNLLVSLLMILLSLPIAWWVGHMIARPIRALTAETDRIRRFELDNDIAIDSHITEVAQLSDSTRAMKGALRDFGRFIPKQLVRDLVTGKASAALGGERREISLMFTDVADFTTLSEKLDPQVLMEKTSQYLERIGQSIIDSGGTIDKYIGDAIMAFWNAPESQTQHVLLACEAALGAAAASRALDREFGEKGEAVMYTRFGVHVGPAVVGNVGSSNRMDFTALGATVNLASRIEGLNKKYGTQILVSGHVQSRAADDFLFRQVDFVVPKGASTPVPIFELIGSLDSKSPWAADAAKQRAAAWWSEIFDHYLGRRWDEVAGELRSYLDQWTNDQVARVLLARVEGFKRVPPPDSWNGAEVMETK